MDKKPDIIRPWIAAVFAVLATSLFIITVACKEKDLIMCSIIHPINYWMVCVLMLSSWSLLKAKPWF